MEPASGFNADGNGEQVPALGPLTALEPLFGSLRRPRLASPTECRSNRVRQLLSIDVLEYVSCMLECTGCIAYYSTCRNHSYKSTSGFFGIGLRVPVFGSLSLGLLWRGSSRRTRRCRQLCPPTLEYCNENGAAHLRPATPRRSAALDVNDSWPSSRCGAHRSIDRARPGALLYGSLRLNLASGERIGA
jgi:hypothetical protein